MLHDVGAVADDARSQDLSLRQFNVLPYPPFVFMAGIGGFNQVCASTDLENEIDNLPERDIGRVRSWPASPANVVAHAIFGDSLQSMVQDVDVAAYPSVVVIEA